MPVRIRPLQPHGSLAQMEERPAVNRDVRGSSPLRAAILRHSTSEVRPALNRERAVRLHLPQPYPGVAHLAERVAWDHEAGRSSRPTRTNPIVWPRGKATGSSPVTGGSSPSTISICPCSSDGSSVRPLSGRLRVRIAPRVPYAPIAQLDRATVFYTVRWRFESALGFHLGA